MLTSDKVGTILHVEDDPALARLVELVFGSFNFRGEIVRAGLVAEAITLLAEREARKAPLDLILVDMELPDGTGLNVLREVRASPAWHMTPVIVLSGETAPGVINEAYALGANCYLPKLARGKGAINSIRALYQCWIEEALLPRAAFADRFQEALARAVRLRARTANFYLGLARACSAEPLQEKFWVERALVEGNISNLFAFFQGQISDRDVPQGTADRALAVQGTVEKTLEALEAQLNERLCPDPAESCRSILALAETLDEEIFAEAFGALFPKGPSVTTALKVRAVDQLRALAGYVLDWTKEPELGRRAEALLAVAGRLAGLGSSGVSTEAEPLRPQGRGNTD